MTTKQRIAKLEKEHKPGDKPYIVKDTNGQFYNPKTKQYMTASQYSELDPEEFNLIVITYADKWRDSESDPDTIRLNFPE